MPTRIIKSNQTPREAYALFDRGELHVVAAYSSPLQEDAAPDREGERKPVLADARREAEQRVQEAYAEGLRRGEEAGQAAFLESVGDAASVFASAAEALRLAHDEFLQSLEHSIVVLAHSAAERVLHRELRHTDTDVVTATVRAAVRAMDARERLVLHLNPADLAALEANGVDVAAEMSDAPDFEIVGDETVTRGGCVIESESLRVDAQLEEQLNRIFNAISM